MNQWLLLVVLGVVVSYQLHQAQGQFSFSLPGKWGSGKRSASAPWSLSGKHPAVGQCTEMDPQTLFSIFKTIQMEALRIQDCLEKRH